MTGGGAILKENYGSTCIPATMHGPYRVLYNLLDASADSSIIKLHEFVLLVIR